MAVPDYQSFMRPLLEITSDEKDWRTGDRKDAVADHVSSPRSRMMLYLLTGKTCASKRTRTISVSPLGAEATT